MKKILITGASGMLAQALIRCLSDEREFEIFAVSSRQIHTSSDKLHYIPLGTEENCFRENEIDCVIHCAFPRNVQPELWADGISYGFKIMFLAKEYSAKSIINISSQSLYGWDRTQPASEDAKIHLTSPYTTGKFSLELLCEQLFEGILHTNLRLATLIGTSSSERVPNRLISDIMSCKSLHIKGGAQIFSFLDVTDAALALKSMLTSQIKSWRHYYNVGTEEYHTLLEIAQMCIDTGEKLGVSGSGIIVEDANIKLDNRISTKAFEQDFTWRATRSLSESITDIFNAAMERNT